MRNHRITKSVFDPARLVGLAVKLPYAFVISNHSGEPLSASVTLGGDRPSQTARLTLSPTISGAG